MAIRQGSTVTPLPGTRAPFSYDHVEHFGVKCQVSFEIEHGSRMSI